MGVESVLVDHGGASLYYNGRRMKATVEATVEEVEGDTIEAFLGSFLS